MTAPGPPPAWAEPVVVAVDGGGSKTDAVVADAGTGEVLARHRGPGCSHHSLGAAAAAAVIDEVVRAALELAGVLPDVVVSAGCYLTAIDLPGEDALMAAELSQREWGGASLTVANDLFALLRSGTEQPDAAVVVCGTGINAAAVRADGAVARIPALGRCSGDWGGGADLAAEVLWLAARAEDGRGADTALRSALLRWTGYATVRDLSIAVHSGDVSPECWQDRVPEVLALASAGDTASRDLVIRQGREIALLARAVLAAVDLAEADVPIVLGGGIAASQHPLLHGAIRSELAGLVPGGRTVVPHQPPVMGALALTLDQVRAG